MGISERKEREKQEMRQRILDAAMKMFLKEGYEKTSIRNIAEAIEYSPATIYLYYKDKDELLYAVQARAFEQLLNLFQTKAKDKNPWKRLQQICRVYVQFGLEEPDLYDLMFIIRAPTNVDEDSHKDNGMKTFQYLVKCLQECIDQQLIRYTDVHIAALSVWAMGHGLVSLQVRCRLKTFQLSEEELDKLLGKSIDQYLQLLKQ